MQPFARLVAFAAAALPFFVLAAPVPEAAAGDVIPGKWIIQLKPEANIAAVASQVQDIHARNIARREISDAETGGIENKYDLGGFKGYSGSFDTATVEELKNLPEVSWYSLQAGAICNWPFQVLNVEPDFIMTTLDVVTRKCRMNWYMVILYWCSLESAPADWGLASISSRTANASDYLYDSSAGEGTFVYVVDTGIRTTHEDFEGRAVWGFNAVNNQNTDNEGHGT
jgi:oryzin